MQAVAAGDQVAGAAPGTGDPLDGVVGEQPQQVEQLLAVRPAELGERLRVVDLEVVDVEVEHAREGGALDELLRAGADGALAVHDRLAVVDVESQQGHAGDLLSERVHPTVRWRADHPTGTARPGATTPDDDAADEGAARDRLEAGRAQTQRSRSRAAPNVAVVGGELVVELGAPRQQRADARRDVEEVAAGQPRAAAGRRHDRLEDHEEPPGASAAARPRSSPAGSST